MLTRFLAAALLVAVTGAPALAGTSDLQLFRDVQRQVLRYPHFTIYDSVNAQIEDGVVTLTGKVTMPFKRDEIAKRVARLNGVDEVNNLIEVLPASSFDDRLRYAIARAIYTDPVFSNYARLVNPPIHVIVERGRVRLEGVVNNELERRVANVIASNFLAFEVTNALKTDEEVARELEAL